MNARAQRRQNQRSVLQEVLVNGPVLRQHLVDATGLTQGSISRIVDDLLSRGLLVEHAGAQHRTRLPGRRSILIDLRSRGVGVASIFLMGEAAQVGLHDLRGRILARRRVPVNRADPKEALLRLRDRAIDLARSEAMAGETLLGVGVGVPAGVDEQGTILLSREWRDVPAAQILSGDSIHAVVVDRIQRGMAISEAWFGGGVGAHSLVSFYISDAVGCGVAIDGRAIRGHNFLEGHIGHIVVPGGRRWCPSCQRRGCLISEISDSAVAESAVQTLGLSNAASNEDVHRQLFASARLGHRGANHLLQMRCRRIGHALALVSTILDPDVIAVSGPTMVMGWDLLQPLIQAEWQRQLPLPALKRRTRIISSPFGRDAELVGCAALVLRAFYDDPQVYWRSPPPTGALHE